MLSLDRIKRETMKLLNTTNEADVAYITDELVSQPAVEITVDDVKNRDRMLRGHSLRYGVRNGNPSYEFLSSSNQWDNICSGRNAYWLSQAYFDHSSAGFNCVVDNNNTAAVTFTSR